MGGDTPKQFLKLKEKVVAHYSLEVFIKSSFFEEIIVVCPKSYRPIFQDYPVRFADPGSSRHLSLHSALNQLSPQITSVVVHDAARPFISYDLLDRLLNESQNIEAVTLGLPVKWTVKEVDNHGFVKKTLPRENIWEIQTPQFVTLKSLKEGFHKIFSYSLNVTDDVSIAEIAGYSVKVIPGCEKNIKLTTPHDWALAQELCR